MNHLRSPLILAISQNHSTQSYINKPANLISNNYYVAKIMAHTSSDLSEDENIDLNNFFNYLNSRHNSTEKLIKNNNLTLKISDEDATSWLFVIEHPYFASLFQVFIILLVCLFVVFVCKCNKIMFACREVIVKPEHVSLEAKIYNDRMTIFDYLCSSCKRCKMKKKKRKNKRFATSI